MARFGLPGSRRLRKRAQFDRVFDTKVQGLRALLRAWVLDPLGLPVVEDLPDSVEVSRRAKEGQTYTFYLNHGEDPVQVQISTPGVDLLTGQEVGRSVELDGYEVLIVKE